MTELTQSKEDQIFILILEELISYITFYCEVTINT